MKTKHTLILADAIAIKDACRAEAVKNNWNVVIAVVDDAGYPFVLERMDSAPLPSADIALGKARTSALARVATKQLEDTVKERPAMLSFPNRMPVQGGVPLFYDGQLVGAIGVSGVKSHEDEQIAFAGAQTIS